MINLIALEKALYANNTIEIAKILSATQLFSQEFSPENQKRLTIIVRRIILADNITALKQLVEHGLDLNNLLPLACSLSLHLSPAMLEYVVSKCANQINNPDMETGYKPLATVIMLAPYPKCKELVHILVKAGAIIDPELFLDCKEHYLRSLLLELAEQYPAFAILADQVDKSLDLTHLEFNYKVSLLYHYNPDSAEFKALIKDHLENVTQAHDAFYLANLFAIAAQEHKPKLAKKIYEIIQQKSFDDKLIFCEHVANYGYNMRAGHKDITNAILDDQVPDIDETKELSIRYYALMYARLYILGSFELCSKIEDIVWELDDTDKVLFAIALMQFNNCYTDAGVTACKFSERRDQLAKRFVSSISGVEVTVKPETIEFISSYLGGIPGVEEKIIKPLKQALQPKLPGLDAAIFDSKSVLFSTIFMQPATFGTKQKTVGTNVTQGNLASLLLDKL